MDIHSGLKLRLLKIRASWGQLSVSKKATLSLMVLALLVFPSAYLLSQSGINLYGRASERYPISNPNPSPTPNPSSTPSDFQVNVSGDRVNATWSAPTTGGVVEDYIIEYRLPNDNSWHVYEDGVQTTTSIDLYLNDEVVTAMDMEARVRAKFKDVDVLSNPSNIVQYTIPQVPAYKPSSPQNLQVTVGTGQITASWSRPDNAERLPIVDYKLEYKVEGSANWTVFVDGVSPATTITATAPTSASPPLHLEARIRAVGNNGQVSDPSDIVSFTLGHN